MLRAFPFFGTQNAQDTALAIPHGQGFCVEALLSAHSGNIGLCRQTIRNLARSSHLRTLAILAILGNPEALPKVDAIQVLARTLGLDVVSLEIREQKKSLRIRSISGRAGPCTGLSMRWNAYARAAVVSAQLYARYERCCGPTVRQLND
jgi:hypothetical protein